MLISIVYILAKKFAEWSPWWYEKVRQDLKPYWQPVRSFLCGRCDKTPSMLSCVYPHLVL
jgi:hypothetical protein